MRAETHTEVYRPFVGELVRHPRRALVLAWSGVRVQFRKKLPVLFLFIVPAIWTIVTAFQVQLKFEAESGNLVRMAGEKSEVRARALGQMLSNQLGEVSEMILGNLVVMQVFVVLIIGWYGSGLIAEDKRLRANLLYFARPLSRWTYIRGKLATVCFWGAMAVVVPTVIIVSVAIFASPEWSYLTQSGDTILKLLLFSALWVLVHALPVLAISSLCDRRNNALAVSFGLYFLTTVGTFPLSYLFDDSSWYLLSIPHNMQRVADALFDQSTFGLDWNIEATIWVLGILIVGSSLILSRQVKKMEVGA